MKIDPPDGFRIPEKPEPKKPNQVSGPQGSQFEGKIDQAKSGGDVDATRGAASASRAESSPSTELRQILDGLDPKDPDHLQQATDRMVDWVLADSFGNGVLQGKGADSLRAAIRDL
ncbi:MAG: hypothetical protein KC729_07040, partial [Candidatus Eisenbacteria bacterium]|nr:hypothetical protein [Candidatus Eisenbacteria bacterium]